jgi:hypothetical protein
MITAIATSDRFDGQYPSRTLFMQALVDRVAIEARLLGWAGATITRFEFSREDGAPGGACAGEWAHLMVAPGQDALTVDRLRQHLTSMREARK